MKSKWKTVHVAPAATVTPPVADKPETANAATMLKMAGFLLPDYPFIIERMSATKVQEHRVNVLVALYHFGLLDLDTFANGAFVAFKKQVEEIAAAQYGQESCAVPFPKKHPIS